MRRSEKVMTVERLSTGISTGPGFPQENVSVPTSDFDVLDSMACRTCFTAQWELWVCQPK